MTFFNLHWLRPWLPSKFAVLVLIIAIGFGLVAFGSGEGILFLLSFVAFGIAAIDYVTYNLGLFGHKMDK